MSVTSLTLRWVPLGSGAGLLTLNSQTIGVVSTNTYPKDKVRYQAHPYYNSITEFETREEAIRHLLGFYGLTLTDTELSGVDSAVFERVQPQLGITI